MSLSREKVIPLLDIRTNDIIASTVLYAVRQVVIVSRKYYTRQIQVVQTGGPVKAIPPGSD